MPTNYAHIALQRFAYGAGQAAAPILSNSKTRSQAQAWLLSQLSSYAINTKSEWSSEQAIQAFYKYRQRLREAKNDKQALKSTKTFRRECLNQAVQLGEGIVHSAIETSQPLQARLTDFFANHFSVSRGNLLMSMLAPTLDTEAIAPNVNQHFSSMLRSVIQHPAMIIYLNNEFSVGPNSRFVRLAKKNNKLRGLNENLAREILELHTLGVNGGYQQQDVIELAKALTGWTIGRGRKGEPTGFEYRKAAHEPGKRKILGVEYSQGDTNSPEQGEGILDALAKHPSTIRHVCTKLARHFISDNPSSGLINALTKAWRASSGHIPSVVKALIEHPDSWRKEQHKFKTPREMLISTYCCFGVLPPSPSIFKSLDLLGQGINNARSPAGYPDTAEKWSGSSALMTRIEWANHVAKQVKSEKKKHILKELEVLLGSNASAHTLSHIRRAESVQQAYVLFIMSPEFQRR
ncbi:DUF1800 domain-containing protein [Agaribacter flavus]|uniref:DUF1800 family protein n=1 Tax=Agaribacter flavus TaxID=1902781 RepID=A0ABV7FNK9_9ALTE